MLSRIEELLRPKTWRGREPVGAARRRRQTGNRERRAESGAELTALRLLCTGPGGAVSRAVDPGRGGGQVSSRSVDDPTIGSSDCRCDPAIIGVTENTVRGIS